MAMAWLRSAMHRHVGLIHNSLMASLVAAGVVFAPDARVWLTSFVELFVMIVAGVMLAAGIFEQLFALSGRKLQAYKTEPKKRLEEALESVRAAFVFSTLAAWPRMYMKLGQPTAIVFTLAEAQPNDPTNYSLYMVKLLLATLGVDAYMYFKHAALHQPLLWAFHKHHHVFHNPSPWGAFAVAPVEAFATFWPVVLLCFPQAPIFAQAYACWTAGFVVLNLYLHSGFDVPVFETVAGAVGLNTSRFHNVHHEKTVRNFGELCYLWDYALKTGAHPDRADGEVPVKTAAAADAPSSKAD